ncbi:unnamed protein product [Meganyctiphanes norvegica]|uniref:p53 DNA-binding domain-containing protein n=1 Tax=Meganyctiphanes norvegica TaxID=48144 RepID=A0AAV2RYZ2_MEGNR
MPISFKCNISLRYNDLVSNDKPVNICHAHQSEANIAAAPNTMFIVKGHNVNDVEYVDVNGHNCCIINSQGEYIIQFFCWNSCDKHRNHNKDMSIYVSFFDNDSGLISKTKKIKLRVAENVKRDAGIMESAKAKKRSIDYMMQDFVEPQILPKKFQVSQDEMEDPIPISPQPEAPTLICIEVNSKDQIELYSLQAKIFGNQMAILQDVLLKDLSD